MPNTENSIQFNFSYYALKLLGKNLYSNPWSAISELVANGLDAQATTVKLFINMSKKEHSTIEILDNGSGMSYEDLANKYVFMGKNKRDDLPEQLKNTVMGRKGIGKLAALFLSKKYYIITKTNNKEESSWYLDSKNADDSSIPTLEKCSTNDANIETIDVWSTYKSGTLIKLADVDLTGIGYYKLEGLKARLANFFLTDSLRSSIEICVLNNETDKIHFEPVKKDIAFKNMYMLFSDDKSDAKKQIASTVVVGKTSYPEVAEKKRRVKVLTEIEFPNIKGEKELTLKDGITKTNVKYEMNGWIGIHTSIENKYANLNDEKYLKNEVFNPNQLRLYVRKKLAVENFLDILKNTQAFSNYIEGEISFDILDDDRFEDIATTNRQSLVTDDERVKLLIEILNPIIGKMIRERVKLGQEVKQEEDDIEAEIKRQREEKEREQEEARQKAEKEAKEERKEK
ncbi:ATP-binding protein [bacterium]|nr:ATP-binding protein [bacterium]